MISKNKIIKKLMLGFFLGSLIILAGCSNSSSDNVNIVKTNVEDNPAFNGNTKTINVEAFKFGFNPSKIEVNYGDKVILTAKSLDVPHGLTIKEYPDVNLYLNGIKSDTVTFIADKKGTFTYYCNVPCGEGHGKMKGTFIVK